MNNSAGEKRDFDSASLSCSHLLGNGSFRVQDLTSFSLYQVSTLSSSRELLKVNVAASNFQSGRLLFIHISVFVPCIDYQLSFCHFF